MQHILVPCPLYGHPHPTPVLPSCPHPLAAPAPPIAPRPPRPCPCAHPAPARLLPRRRPVVSIDSYEDVPPHEEALVKAVANQPIAVGICAGA